MLIRATDLEIPASEPFLHDRLERKKYAEPLTQLVGNTPGPFVLAVDGGWGTGKTTFLRMWCRHLQNEGHRCLYFNAWKNDFAVDPLAALVAELKIGLTKQGKLSPKSRRRLTALKKLGGRLAQRYAVAAVAAVAAAAYEVFSSDSTAETDEAQIAAEKAADATSAVVSDAIDNYLQTRIDLDAFRERLTELVREISPQNPAGISKKVVMFIDELDRCRPLYAVELLERVKHLFDVPGVTFVLGLDLEQLAHSVKAVNGGTFDASGYLRRFIDLPWRLPAASPENFAELPVWAEIKEVFAAIDFPWDRQMKIDLIYLFSTLSLSVRSQIQALNRLALMVRTLSQGSRPPTQFLVLALVVNEWKPSLLRDLGVRETAADELYNQLNSMLDFRRSRPSSQAWREEGGLSRARMESAILAAAWQSGFPCQALESLRAWNEAREKNGPLNQDDSDEVYKSKLFRMTRAIAVESWGDVGSGFIEAKAALDLTTAFRLP